ncbi:MAG: helix-turn-helix transcriptional regulator [Eubacterium sp.]
MDNMDFANRISELRRERGLSQKELGDMLGVSNKAVSKWENGESLPKTSTMLKLAELFDIDGNELIGFEVKERTSDSTEINNLKQENNVLRSQLSYTEKRRKRALLVIVCVCLACIIGSIVIAVCFRGDYSKYNKNIPDAGEQGTKIVFDNISFYPADTLENYIISQGYGNLSDESDTKYAEYYSAGGDKQKVVVFCSQDDSYISIKAGSKEYYYFNQNNDSKILITPENIYCIDFYNSSIADGSRAVRDDYSYITKSYTSYDDDSDRFFKQFCDFYNDKPSAADSKITERYLGSGGITVHITLDESLYDYSYYEFDIGEFFRDDDGKVYFYDYVDTASYPVGKELSAYVY